MKDILLPLRVVVVLAPVIAVACATEVTPDAMEPEGQGAESSGGNDGGTSPTAGKPPSSSSGGQGGKPSTGGTGTSAFGGTSSTGGSGTAGTTSEGGASGSGSGGGGTTTAGSGGKAGGGSGGTSGGGTSGAAGTAGTGGSAGSAGSSGSGPIGAGDCAGTEAFEVGEPDKYAQDELVVAECAGGTPCTLAKPPLTTGKVYEFKCLDRFNCGKQDPGTTNWSQPPWAVTRACED